MWHRFEEINLLNELALSEEDEETSKEVGKELIDLTNRVEKLEIQSYFTDKFDLADAIVSINAGAGGTESCDWTGMLFRMYSRWAEEKNYKIEVNDFLANPEAGFKSIVFMVKGRYAYGHLKSERGIHRLVRISPFDFNQRRHTSFASVDVIPALDEEVEVEIDPKDLKIETFRASGPGGQYVNVTDSAVRITHLPTKITAQCQNERSQFQNKETAMKILRARLYDLEMRKREEQIESLRGEKKEIAWGSQIRSYILHPYNLVKDHRTGKEDPRVEEVLGGNIDEFIYSYLKSAKKA